ncbi:EpsG family protein [Vibrio parahaemolyticus]|uniref:EpsG family protein n=3 Tax=Vibrio parahaemolyticus TaxID=670 RepID=UPI0006B26F18|nr:EpsG family protein [Vibrio parahaemolyticus]AOV91165.1 hypothetical protein FORC23_2622 [Vibrio parahaemolyticus]EGR1549677.1 EpsG family protein [Vibrio parahaemolyticus]EGR2221478.1 EpsG family protein [Vibrio parahaemolyticus]EGR2784220.1 EpsG family protein [Vibrio parahaemolyticus]EHH2506046.1 EpsG family protein [Vibrio parahaemolyticus]
MGRYNINPLKESIVFLSAIVIFFYYPVFSLCLILLLSMYLDVHPLCRIFIFSILYGFVSLYISVQDFPTADISSYYRFILEGGEGSYLSLKFQRLIFQYLYSTLSIPIQWYGLYCTFLLSFSLLFAMYRFSIFLGVGGVWYWATILVSMLSPVDILAYENLVAFGVSILAYSYIFEGRIKRAIFLFIFAATFHVATIFAVFPFLVPLFFTSVSLIFVVYALIVAIAFYYLNFSGGVSGVLILDIILGKVYSYLFGPWSKYIRIYEYILFLMNFIKVILSFYTSYKLKSILRSKYLLSMINLSVIMFITLPFSALSFRVMYLWILFVPFLFYILKCEKTNFHIAIKTLYVCVLIFLSFPRFADYYRFIPTIIMSEAMSDNVFERSLDYNYQGVLEYRNSDGSNRE